MGNDNRGTRILSAGVGFIPVLGSVKCIVDSVSGKDFITGTKLSNTERGLSAVGAIPGFQGVKYLAKGTRIGSKVYKGIETVDTANSCYNLGKSFTN